MVNDQNRIICVERRKRRSQVNLADDVDPTSLPLNLPPFSLLFTCDDTNDIRFGPDRPSFDLTLTDELYFLYSILILETLLSWLRL